MPYSRHAQTPFGTRTAALRRLHPVRHLPLLAVVLGLLLLAPPAPAAQAGADRAAAPNTARAPGLDPGLPVAGAASQRVVVTGTDRGTDVGEVVRRHGGSVTARLPLVHGVAATLPADRLQAVAGDPAVRAVTADQEGRLVEYAWSEDSVASNFARTTQATSAWSAGNYGRGVGVAVLDTGVAATPDLAGRLVHGPDLSGEGTTVDSYGHGTVMAGLIAGNGADSAGRSNGAFTGVAPAAHVVSVKVAGRNGVVDVSTVLQAMHWVSVYRQQYGIRVLNIAWGIPSSQSPAVDPLNYAVQRLWRQGVVVVVAAGNSGPNGGTVTKPGDDPVVLTVGAFNDQGDVDPGNDSVPAWSSRGPTAAGLAKPDLVAPGRSVVAARSYGSAVETDNPKALVAPSYIRGSGTSQSSAVTSGAVALLLAARPELTPDQVKQVLRGTAVPIAGVDPAAQGQGRLHLGAAVAAAPPPTAPTAQPASATGLGSINASRAGRYVVADCGGVSTEINGEIDVRCQPWQPESWTGSAWTGDSWTGVTWKGAEWTGVTWKGAAWSDATWTGVTWKGGTWTAGSWLGGTPWSGSTVSTSPWTGVTWKDATWTGVTWKQGDFTSGAGTSGGQWTSDGQGASGTPSADSDFLTSFWGARPEPGKRVAGETYTPVRATAQNAT